MLRTHQNTWHGRGPSGASASWVGERSGQSAVLNFHLVATQGHWTLALRCSEVSACSVIQSLRSVTPGFAWKVLSRAGQKFLEVTGQLSKQTFWWEAFKEDLPHVMVKNSPPGESIHLGWKTPFLHYFNQTKDLTLTQGWCFILSWSRVDPV